jgi:rhodanese-related sulfurtransferase
VIRRFLRRAAGRALRRGQSDAPAFSPEPAGPAPAPKPKPKPEPEPEPEPEVEVDDATLATWMQDGAPLVLLDIRESHELQHGVAEGALLIRMNDIPQRMNDLPLLDSRIVVYCAAGSRSFGVTHWLRENGWTDAWSLTSGYHGYLRVSEQVSTASETRNGGGLADLAQIQLALGPAGRPRLVNHWATWCEGCIEELPLLVQLHQRFGDKIEFIGLSWDGFQGGLEGEALLAQVQAVSRSHGLEWGSLIASAEPEALFEALEMQVHTVPQIWLLDAEGRVVHRQVEVLQAEGLEALAERMESLI